MNEILLYTLYACVNGGYCYQIDETYHITELQCKYYANSVIVEQATSYKCVDVYRSKTYILSLPEKKEIPSP